MLQSICWQCEDAGGVSCRHAGQRHAGTDLSRYSCGRWGPAKLTIFHGVSLPPICSMLTPIAMVLMWGMDGLSADQCDPCWRGGAVCTAINCYDLNRP
jgi:hypothetical protein